MKKFSLQVALTFTGTISIEANTPEEATQALYEMAPHDILSRGFLEASAEVFGAEDEEPDTIYECCPHCGVEVEIPAIMKRQPCPNCGELMAPCTHCRDLGNTCIYDADANTCHAGAPNHK